MPLIMNKSWVHFFFFTMNSPFVWVSDWLKHSWPPVPGSWVTSSSEVLPPDIHVNKVIILIMQGQTLCTLCYSWNISVPAVLNLTCHFLKKETADTENCTVPNQPKWHLALTWSTVSLIFCKPTFKCSCCSSRSDLFSLNNFTWQGQQDRSTDCLWINLHIDLSGWT